MKYTQAKPKAALFDLDGTLFDTDTANLLSYRDAFGSFGFVLTEQCWLEHCSGRCFKDFLPDIFDCTDETAKQIHMIKKKRYPLYLDRCVPNVSLFAVGEKVDVSGVSKGKGFAGGVKRYHFRGGPKTHGQSDRLRAPGSRSSTTTPGRVFKGARGPGHMGSDAVTAQNLKVVLVDAERNVIGVNGSVPGARGGLVVIKESRKV